MSTTSMTTKLMARVSHPPRVDPKRTPQPMLRIPRFFSSPRFTPTFKARRRRRSSIAFCHPGTSIHTHGISNYIHAESQVNNNAQYSIIVFIHIFEVACDLLINEMNAIDDAVDSVLHHNTYSFTSICMIIIAHFRKVWFGTHDKMSLVASLLEPDPRVIYEKRIFVWLPTFTFPVDVAALPCPHCRGMSTRFEKLQNHHIGREILDIHDTFFIIGGVHYCRDCDKNFSSTNSTTISLLPCHIQSVSLCVHFSYHRYIVCKCGQFSVRASTDTDSKHYHSFINTYNLICHV